MASYSEQTDRTKRIVLTPEITRAFWSQRRAWHGENVQLHIETKHVPDSTPLKIQIWEEDTLEGNPDDFIVELDDNHTVSNNLCIIDYSINWDEDTLAKELVLEGNEMEFYFLVIVEPFDLQKKSTLLYVGISSFLFSS